MVWCELWPRKRHNGRKTFSLLWSVRGKSCPNTILKWLQRLVCSWFRHISLILSRSCDRLGSGTREWILILKTTYFIIPNTWRPLWSMWRTNTAWDIDVCLVTKPENILNNNLSSSGMASRSGQSSYHLYDLSSDDKEYLMHNNVAKTTPGQSNRAACLLSAAMLYLNSPSELPQNWGQINLNLNDYHSDPMEISRTFWLLDITNWWRQQEETHSKYPDLSNVAHDIFSIIPHGVGVEVSYSLGRDVIGWRQSKTTGETLCEKVVSR